MITAVIGLYGFFFCLQVFIYNRREIQTTVVNQTSSAMNQTSTNQTASKPDLTTSDVQYIRKTLEEIRKDIAEGKVTEALKAINDMDNKLLVAMSDNPMSKLI